MIQRNKKITAYFLALIMMLSIFPTNVFGSVVSAISAQSGVEAMSGIAPLSTDNVVRVADANQLRNALQSGDAC